MGKLIESIQFQFKLMLFAIAIMIPFSIYGAYLFISWAWASVFG